MKRANLVVMTAFSLLAGAFVLILFQRVAYTLATNEEFYLKYQANDIRYLVHALYATPGNAIANYPEDTSEYIYDFRGDSLEIRKPGMATQWERILVHIVPRKGQRIEKTVEGEQLVFSKVSEKITVNDAQNINLMACPAEGDMRYGLLILHHDGSAEMEELAKRLETPASPFGIARLSSEPEKDLSESVDMFISLRLAENAESAGIRYTAGSPAALKAACNIANALTDGLPELTGLSVAETSEAMFMMNRVALQITIPQGLHKDPGRLAAAIRKGLRQN